MNMLPLCSGSAYHLKMQLIAKYPAVFVQKLCHTVFPLHAPKYTKPTSRKFATYLATAARLQTC